MPQMSQVLRERAIGMLTAGMSTRAVARELNVHFSTISHLQMRFREFGSTSNRPLNRRPRVTTPAQDLHIQHLHLQDHLRPATRTAAATIGLHNQIISAQTVRNRLREAHLHARRPHRGLDLTAVRCRNRLEWANAHIRWHLALWRGVLCTRMHGPMLQGSVHNSWKLKTSQFLHGQHTHRTCHPLNMFGMLWIGVYDSMFQFLPISSNFTQPLKRSGPTFHRPQSTTWSTLCEGVALHCMRQMVVTPDTDWFSDPPPNTVKLHILEWPFIVASLRHTCAIIMLSNQHLDMPHLWGGWIISAKEKCSLTQI